MSNERIDLTQFESKHSTELYQRIQDYIRGDDYPDEIPLRIMGLYSEPIAELRRCYDREEMIIRVLKDAWIGDTCWHQPSEHLEDIAETRGSKLGRIASLLRVDVNRQDIHDLDGGCSGENCDHNASE